MNRRFLPYLLVVTALVFAGVAGFLTLVLEEALNDTCARLDPGPGGLVPAVCRPPGLNYPLAAGVAIAVGVLAWFALRRAFSARKRRPHVSTAATI
jgi:hypothetical protein